MSETVTEKAGEVTDKAGEATEQVGSNGNGLNAKKFLIPAAAGVGTLAATYAASKAPSLFKDKVVPRLEEKGSEEVAKVGKQAASNLTSGGGVLGAVAGKVAGVASGKSGGGREKTRRLPIQRWTDVAVPVETAYEKWTQFEDFPKFMHRVVSVEQKEDNLVAWEEKIWFSKRQWEAEILENSKNDRVVWKTTQGTSHTGLVSFHELDDKLTRVMVTLDFRPSGMFEKMASGLRFAKRAVQADLARFKAYVELEEVEGAEYTHEATTESDKDEAKDKEKDEDTEKDEDKEGRSRSDGRGDSSEVSERDLEEAEKSRNERAERRQKRRS
jgi:uncharacterized membrane protein